MNLNGKRIVIAKTNHIGDVAISLPMATWIKLSYPKAKVILMANGATCEIARMNKNIDETHDWQIIINSHDPVVQLRRLKADVFIHASPCKKMANLVKQAEIPIRVGSVFRVYHWHTCNRLAMISRRPGLNKRILDLQYLTALDMKVDVTEHDLPALYQVKQSQLKKAHQAFLAKDKFNLVIHPGARTAQPDGWSIANYKALIAELDKDKFHILISGVAEEREKFAELLAIDGVVDLMGRMTLASYFNFLRYVDGLISGSTGPLHLACAQNKPVLGLYRHKKSYIKRWGPIGSNSSVLSARGGVNNISVQQVQARLQDWVI